MCGIGLFVGPAEDVVMLGCGRCGGQWLDNAGTKRVVDGILSEEARRMAQEVSARHSGQQRKAQHYRDPGKRPPRPCPICAQPMHTTLVAEVRIEIEVCAAHGTWFDAHELDALARHFAFKAAVTDAEAAIDTAAINRATANEGRAQHHQGFLRSFLTG